MSGPAVSLAPRVKGVLMPSHSDSYTYVRSNPPPTEIYDTWAGVECQYAPGCDAACVPTGGGYALAGDPNIEVLFAGAVTTQQDFGDPGYHVHFRVPTSNTGFTITTSVDCVYP